MPPPPPPSHRMGKREAFRSLTGVGDRPTNERAGAAGRRRTYAADRHITLVSPAIKIIRKARRVTDERRDEWMDGTDGRTDADRVSSTR